jgi:GDP/UDP-N,N'-diacetylbacillosamine 2-epimerase (hydrolysing)
MGGSAMMKIGVLTSSRADYGIYTSLLRQLSHDPSFDLEIIVFGTHLSHQHGYTVDAIKKDGYGRIHQIASLLANDDPEGIATSYGLTVVKFSEFWKVNNFDWVFCLGDRFEMSAAVQSGIPYRVRFAHIHGGETTLGAMDNVYRHQISLASDLHFVSAPEYAVKLSQLCPNASIHHVGSLSVDAVVQMQFVSREQFLKHFELPDEEFVLVTFHPETMVDVVQNQLMADAMYEALTTLSDRLFLVITMPNADTFGSVFRQSLQLLQAQRSDRVKLVENFGQYYYFHAMKYARLLIGNTSSGIIEAASFGKYVINVGDRQKGRAVGDNVIHSSFELTEMLQKVECALSLGTYNGTNIYYKAGAAKAIIQILKNEHA